MADSNRDFLNNREMTHQEKKQSAKKRRNYSERIGSFFLSKVKKNVQMDESQNSQNNLIDLEEKNENENYNDYNETDTPLKKPREQEEATNKKLLMTENSKLMPKTAEKKHVDIKEPKKTHIRSQTETKNKLDKHKEHVREASLGMLVTQNKKKNERNELGKLFFKKKNKSSLASALARKQSKIDYGPMSKTMFDVYLNKKKSRGLSENALEYFETRKIILYHSQLISNAILQATIALISVIVAIGNYVDYYDYENSNSRTNHISASFSLLLTLILILQEVLEYFTYSRIMGVYYKIPPWIVRQNPYNLALLIFTICFYCIHPMPFLVEVQISSPLPAYNTTIKYYLNNIFSVILVARLFLVFKAILYSSAYYQPRYDRIGNMNGIIIDMMFSFKSLMMDSPLLCYPILLGMFWLFGTFGIVVAEAPVEKFNGVNFASFWNAAWCMIITILTVGFGDFYPRTVFGRIITIITALSGNFLFSTLVATVSSVFSFNNKEFSTCLLINRIDLLSQKEVLSRSVVTEILTLKRLCKEFHKPDANVEKAREFVSGSKSRLVSKNIMLKDCLNEITESYRVAEGDNYFFYQANTIEQTLELLKMKYDSITERFEKLEIKDKDSEINDDNINKKFFTSGFRDENKAVILNESILDNSENSLDEVKNEENLGLKAKTSNFKPNNTKDNHNDDDDKVKKHLKFI